MAGPIRVVLAKPGLEGHVRGAKAIAHLIETSAQSDKTLLVNSTPIIVKSLSKELPQSFRDRTPVAAIVTAAGRKSPATSTRSSRGRPYMRVSSQ